MKQPDSKTSLILDKPLSSGKNEVSFSAFSFLFSEIVRYNQNRVKSTQELEERLAAVGHEVGIRQIELLTFREKGDKREIRLVPILQFIHGAAWKNLFGRHADGLEKSTEREDEYFLIDKNPITNKYISIPKSMGQLNCASYMAGIVSGMLEGAGFPCEVTAHSAPNDTSPNDSDNPEKTVFVMRFSQHVIQREKKFSEKGT